MILFFIILSWYIYLIDPYGGAADIAFDTYGNAHIFYYSGDQQGVFHSWWNGSSWQNEMITSIASYYNGAPAATFDDQNRIHLAYYTSEEKLGYALYDGTWHFEIADTTTKTGNFCSITLDHNGNPHIAHRRIGFITGYLRYTTKFSGSWGTYEFSSETGGFHTSIAIDSQNRVHIADCTDGDDLRYIWWDGSSWQIEKPVLDFASTYSSMVLDSQDRPQISYYHVNSDSNCYDLRFTNRNSGNWQIWVVDHGEQLFKRGWDNKMVMDQNGNLHIVYHAHNECLVKYAVGYEGSWSLSVVDTVGMWYAFCNIGIWGDDVFLTYCDSDGLWLATTRNYVGVEENWDNEKNLFISNEIPLKKNLKVYDILGRCVLMNKYGLKKFQFKNTGIYFIRTERGLKKIIYIR